MIKFEHFLEHSKDVKGLSPDTLSAYRSDLKQFASFLATQNINRISQIDHALITRYVSFMKVSAPNRGGRVGLSGATIVRRLAAISSFFDYTRANSSRKIANPIDNFSIRWERNNRPKPVERDIINKLFTVIDSPRDKVILTLFLATGLRLSEMAQLDRGSITIQQTSEGSQGKAILVGVGEVVGKGNKRRVFYVSANALLPYALYLEDRKDDHPALFLSERRQRMSKRAMQERLAHWCRKAEVPHTRVHRLRHTFATWVANAGMEIHQLKELLGHRSISTTLQYTKVMDATLAQG